jgi:hypothetical protein
MAKVISAYVIALCVYVFVLNNLWDVLPAEMNLSVRLAGFSLIIFSPFIAYRLYKNNLDY